TRLKGEINKLVEAKKHEEAFANAEKILPLEKEVFGEKGPQRLPWLQVMVKNYTVKGNFARAIALQQEVVAIEEARCAKDDWRVTDARLHVGHLELLERRTPEERLEINKASEQNKQVVRLINAGQYKQAVELAQEVLRVRKRLLTENHPDYATSL